MIKGRDKICEKKLEQPIQTLSAKEIVIIIDNAN